jgi:two-component system KDP operon response regulator KdpE
LTDERWSDGVLQKPIVHPYRDPPELEPRAPAGRTEERVLYGVMALIGAIPVWIALASRTHFGVEATIGLFMVVVGWVGLGSSWRRRRDSSRDATCTAVARQSCDVHAVAATDGWSAESPQVAHALLAPDPDARVDRSAPPFGDEPADMSDDKLSVLIVDDEVAIRKFLRSTLTSHGLDVRETGTIGDAERMIVEDPPAAILLDLSLPDGDGLDLLRRVREWSATPIIILSARARELDKVNALDAGADDYVTKPFAPNELAARVRSAIRASRRKGQAATSPILEVGEIRIDRARHLTTRGGDAVHLTPIEFRLLVVLACNSGKVITHNQLTAEVLGVTGASGSHHLRVHVAALRRKLEADPARPRWLHTEIGVGYRISNPEPKRKPPR